MWKECWLDLYQFPPAPLDGLATHAKPYSVGSGYRVLPTAMIRYMVVVLVR
jgi:hypothetical protein